MPCPERPCAPCSPRDACGTPPCDRSGRPRSRARRTTTRCRPSARAPRRSRGSTTRSARSSRGSRPTRPPRTCCRPRRPGISTRARGEAGPLDCAGREALFQRLMHLPPLADIDVPVVAGALREACPELPAPVVGGERASARDRLAAGAGAGARQPAGLVHRAAPRLQRRAGAPTPTTTPCRASATTTSRVSRRRPERILHRARRRDGARQAPPQGGGPPRRVAVPPRLQAAAAGRAPCERAPAAGSARPRERGALGALLHRSGARTARRGLGDRGHAGLPALRRGGGELGGRRSRRPRAAGSTSRWASWSTASGCRWPRCCTTCSGATRAGSMPLRSRSSPTTNPSSSTRRKAGACASTPRASSRSRAR